MYASAGTSCAVRSLAPAQATAIYTHRVIPAREGIDWRSFLERAALPEPSPDALSRLRQERILLTGAGGSIGSALALRLAALAPDELILLDADEGRLLNFQSTLGATGLDSYPKPILGSILDRNLLDEVFDRHRPTLVFHAAAYKHVPLLEEQPFAAIENNIFGTHFVVLGAQSHGARVVLLSTDKAVEPTSIMGATKRIAELLVLASGGTVLRLGNVLASSGSVAEIFAGQIAAGGPITVTDLQARRYFLTLEEAVHLLIEASAETRTSSLFVSALHKQLLIADLARFLARQLSPQRDVPIRFTAPRPGDKESEKLWGVEEGVDAQPGSGLLKIVSPHVAEQVLRRNLEQLKEAFDARDLVAALDALRAMVPSFMPSATLLSLAQQSATRVTP